MHVCANLYDRLFWQALTDYRAELRDDPIISTHLAKLYDNLLEQNLIRVIEPFSRVQVITFVETLALLWWARHPHCTPALPTHLQWELASKGVPGGQEATKSLRFS